VGSCLRSVLLFVATAAGCARARPDPYLAPVAYVESLRRCRLPALGDTAGWRRWDGAPGLLPPGFREDTAAARARGYIHGGRLWRDAAGRELEIANGSWGPASFTHDLGVVEMCRARLAGLPTLLVRRRAGGRYTASVWLARARPAGMTSGGGR